MSLLIQPGDYVAVSDITCEAIHAAVVKCFEAAGGVKQHGYGDFSDSRNECNTIFLIDPEDNGLVHGGFHNAKPSWRQLTLQQLFTATNSIRWPDWATDIRLCGDRVWFYGGVGKHKIIVGDPNAVVAPNVPLILAIREDYSTIRPAPELGWYDWSADRARELPPVGIECEVLSEGDEIRQFHVVWSGNGVVFGYDCNAPYIYAHFSAETHGFRPVNYEQRKADLERDKIVAKASQVMCDVIKKGMKPDESYYGQYALALYEAGLLRERAV